MQILLTTCQADASDLPNLNQIKAALQQIIDNEFNNEYYCEDTEIEELEELFQTDAIEEFPFLSNEEERYRENMSSRLISQEMT